MRPADFQPATLRSPNRRRAALAALLVPLLLAEQAPAAPPPPPPAGQGAPAPVLRQVPPPPVYVPAPPPVYVPVPARVYAAAPPPPLPIAMRVIYAPFYVTGLILRYGAYYLLVAPLEVLGRTLDYGVDGGVEPAPGSASR